MTVTFKEEIILTTASSLFSEFGFHAVGVDRIIAESKIAKMTLYKYFPSKEILIEKVLLNRDQLLRESILDAVNKNKTGMKKLKAIFDWYQNWFESPEFHGCMFIKAAEEFSNKAVGIREIAQNHKIWMMGLIRSILQEVGTTAPEKLASYVMLILDGLTVKANMFENIAANQTDIAWNYVKSIVK